MILEAHIFSLIKLITKDSEMLSGHAWIAFARFIKITQYFCTHPFEVNYINPTQNITFIVTKSKLQLVCCGILSLYLFIDSCLYETIALCFYYKSDTYANFIKNYTHLFTRAAASVVNLVFIVNRGTYAQFWSTLSKVFVKEIQGKHNFFRTQLQKF